MHQPTSKSLPGFTLIEVLITLVVIAIVAALSAPAILSMAPSMTLKSAAQELYSTIQEAKIIAVKENKDVGVRVGTAGIFIGEPFTDTNENGIFDAGDVFDAAEHDYDGDGVPTAIKTIDFAGKYEYGIGLGTGNATADWDGNPCVTLGNSCNTPAAAITFNSRGTSNADSAFLENKNGDISYAVTVNVAGSVKIRKYGGADPFNVNNWTE